MTSTARPLALVEAAALLGATVPILVAEVAALPEPLLSWHPAPGEWCTKAVLGHLIEAEQRGFAGRVRALLEQENPAFEPWDPDAVARARRDCEREATALLDELATLREASRRLVETLGEPDLARSGRHPVVGRLCVGDLLHEWVHHDRNHVRQALANVQAFVWPAMGNARLFSAPAAAGPPAARD